MRLPWPPLLVITDRHQAVRPLEEIADAAFAVGCRWLSLREKDLPGEDRLRLLRRLIAVGRPWGAVVGVHGDQAAAALCRVPLHLPSGASTTEARGALGPHALIGLSGHDDDLLAGADVETADYMTMSPYATTRSKPGYGPALGAPGLAACVSRAVLPVIALGGIAAADVTDCLAAGAAGVAVMGSVMRAAEPDTAVRDLLRGFSLSLCGRGSG